MKANSNTDSALYKWQAERLRMRRILLRGPCGSGAYMLLTLTVWLLLASEALRVLTEPGLIAFLKW